MKSPDVVARLKEQGVKALGGSPKQFADFVETENKRWESLAKQVHFLPSMR